MSAGKEHLVQRLLIVAFLLGVFTLSATGILYLALRGRTVEVPDVTGKSEARAADELEGYGLRLQVKSRAHSEQAPANTVSDQTPAAGTIVKTGQLVRVSISLGAPPNEKKAERQAASKTANR